LLGFFLGKQGCEFYECNVTIKSHNQMTDRTYLTNDCEIARILMEKMVNEEIPYNYTVKLSKKL
jgi:hypothetical protein